MIYKYLMLKTHAADSPNSFSHKTSSFDAFTRAYQPTPCLFGRPDWPVSLARISKENPGSKVGESSSVALLGWPSSWKPSAESTAKSGAVRPLVSTNNSFKVIRPI